MFLDDLINVLVIDDQEGVSGVFSQMLDMDTQYIGEVFVCESVAGARYFIETNHIDVVILDLFLKESSDLDTLALFRKEYKNIPVVVVTGHDYPGLAYECFMYGADDFLSKPNISPILLVKSCVYSVDRRRVSRERQELLEREQLLVELLKLLNEPYSGIDTVKKLLERVQEFTKVQAIAIRLQDSEDFPYFVYKGFGEDFIIKENSLCSIDEEGNARYGSDGERVLECMCGCVIRGNTDRALPCFTEGGSFWTNSTTELLDHKHSLLQTHPTRGECNWSGYESVAIIPLSAGVDIIGTLQLNDTKKDFFSKELILFLEELALSIGVAVKRAWQEDKIKSLEIAKTKDLLQSSRLLNAGIAHELRTPMQALLNCFELIREEVDLYCEHCSNCKAQKLCKTKEVLVELVEEGLDRTEYSVRVLNSLSEYSKIASSDEVHLINVVPELKTIMRTLEFTDSFKSLEEGSFVLVAPDEHECFVEINRVDFSQLIINLCRNSIEAIDHEDPKIRIEIKELDSEVQIVVRDNGRGIDPSLGEKIFNPYFSTKAKPEGNNQGLGLAMVRDIIAAYGGSITYKSEPGNTQFIIKLPCERRSG